MSEPPTRHSTRAKKPPKFRQLVDSEYGTYGQGKASEVRDSMTSAQQANQLAKLLMKFLSSANQKAKDIQKDSAYHLSTGGPSLDYQRPRNLNTRYQEPRNHYAPPEGLVPPSKAQRDAERQPAQSASLGTRPINKKTENSRKEKPGLSSSIESDLSYHTMLGRHIRSNLPDSQNLSTEMLKQLGLPPRDRVEQSRAKEQQKKKRTGACERSNGRENRQQLKPFKRQSYHVAIAYHIFLQKVKAGPEGNPRDIDPTYNARKLRQKNQKHQ